MIALALLAAQAEPAGPVAIPDPEAIRTMHDFASCVARERTGEARAALATDFRAPTYSRRLQALARSTNHCFRRRWMRMSELAFAGSLAEHLFLRAHGSTDPSAVVASGEPLSRNRTEALANCVVRNSPVAARAVLDTPVTSAEEARALDALRPAIGSCLQPPEQVELNPIGLRSLVALAFYHLASARIRER